MWTEERIAELKTLIAGGTSRGAIAAMWDVPRNAIVGKAWRLGLIGPNDRNMGGLAVVLKKRKKEKQPFSLARIAKNRKPPVHIEARADEPEPLRVSLLDLNESHCRWVCDSTDDHCLPQYCGHPASDGRWCDYHRTRVFVR